MDDKPPANGMIWWSRRGATIGLIVADGAVVDCPPYARRWALGVDARELWRRGIRQGATLKWLPTAAAPVRLLPHITPHEQPVQRWVHLGDIPDGRHHLAIGETADGRWYVNDTAETAMLVFGAEDEAWAEVERRTASDDRWQETHASAPNNH